MSNIVIIPTYKESENIEALVKAISEQKVAFDILIVDDNSPDGTADIVKNLQKSFSNLHLVERPEKLGLGIVLTDEIKNKYPFEPGSGEFISVPGKILEEDKAWM